MKIINISYNTTVKELQLAYSLLNKENIYNSYIGIKDSLYFTTNNKTNNYNILLV